MLFIRTRILTEKKSICYIMSIFQNLGTIFGHRLSISLQNHHFVKKKFVEIYCKTPRTPPIIIIKTANHGYCPTHMIIIIGGSGGVLRCISCYVQKNRFFCHLNNIGEKNTSHYTSRDDIMYRGFENCSLIN